VNRESVDGSDSGGDYPKIDGSPIPQSIHRARVSIQRESDLRIRLKAG
jgi:hypothetical protein